MRQTVTIIAQRAAAIAAGLLLLLFTTAAHNIIRPMSVHAMGNMEHESSTSVACVSLCSTAIVKREGIIKHTQEEQDNDHDPAPAYLTTANTPSFLKSLYPTNQPLLEPPGKIPLHKLNVVFLD